MFKKIIKKIFSLFGLQISKISKKQEDSLDLQKIGNFKINLGANHSLPKILERWPNYSSNLPRLASKLKEKYPKLLLIDVGANVGDTVALLRSKEYFPIVCIEGDGDFFKLLNQNIQQFKDVSTFQYFLGEESGLIDATIKKADGTAKIIKSSNKIQLITLDDFINSHPDFQLAKILKIDTDGYDLKIIRGGLEYIKNTKPVLFIEYDEVYLSKINDDGLTTLKVLKDIGYNKVMFYDNFGRFLLSTELKNNKLIKQLHLYIKNKKGGFPYYDLCIFHEDDNDIATKFIKDETQFNLK